MKQNINEIKRMQQLAGIFEEYNTPNPFFQNGELQKDLIISVLKKYEDPNDPFYKTNFEDYMTDLQNDEYEGTHPEDIQSEKELISDYTFWKKLGSEIEDEFEI
jgi:hypothetical protein